MQRVLYILGIVDGRTVTSTFIDDWVGGYEDAQREFIETFSSPTSIPEIILAFSGFINMEEVHFVKGLSSKYFNLLESPKYVR